MNKEELYNLYYKDVYFNAFKITRNEEISKDITHDAFVKAYEKIDTLNDNNKFRAWIVTIATNMSLNYLKHNKIIDFVSTDDDESINEIPENGKTPEECVIEDEVKDTLREIIDSLPDQYRITVFMYYYQELSVKEIASICGCSDKTVYQRLNYAMKAIRKEVNKLENKGHKLRCLAILPFLYVLFNMEAKDAYAATTVPEYKDMDKLLLNNNLSSIENVLDKNQSGLSQQVGQNIGAQTIMSGAVIQGGYSMKKIIALISCFFGLVIAGVIIALVIGSNKNNNNEPNRDGLIDVLESKNDLTTNIKDNNEKNEEEYFKYIDKEKKIIIGLTDLGKEQKTLTIPKEIEEIRGNAFYGNNNLEKIEILNPNIKLGSHFCCICKNLKEIVLPDDLKEIPDFAFSGCTALENFEFPSGIEKVGRCAFNNTGLKKAIIPAKVDYLCQTFSNCEMEEIVFEESDTVCVCNMDVFGLAENAKAYVNRQLEFIYEVQMHSGNERVNIFNANAKTLKTLTLYCIKDSVVDGYNPSEIIKEKVYYDDMEDYRKDLDEEEIIYEGNGVLVYLTGMEISDGLVSSGGIRVNVRIKNNTDNVIMMQTQNKKSDIIERDAFLGLPETPLYPEQELYADITFTCPQDSKLTTVYFDLVCEVYDGYPNRTPSGMIADEHTDIQMGSYSYDVSGVYQ